MKIHKIKLTEKDLKVIDKHGDICTDFHGMGCSVTYSADQNKNDKQATAETANIYAFID